MSREQILRVAPRRQSLRSGFREQGPLLGPPQHAAARCREEKRRLQSAGLERDPQPVGPGRVRPLVVRGRPNSRNQPQPLDRGQQRPQPRPQRAPRRHRRLPQQRPVHVQHHHQRRPPREARLAPPRHLRPPPTPTHSTPRQTSAERAALYGNSDGISGKGRELGLWFEGGPLSRGQPGSGRARERGPGRGPGRGRRRAGARRGGGARGGRWWRSRGARQTRQREPCARSLALQARQTTEGRWGSRASSAPRRRRGSARGRPRNRAPAAGATPARRARSSTPAVCSIIASSGGKSWRPTRPPFRSVLSRSRSSLRFAHSTHSRAKHGPRHLLVVHPVRQRAPRQLPLLALRHVHRAAN